MVTQTPFRSARTAAVSASTVFAIALAIVAGLIFAWLFKMVLLDKPKVTKPPDDTEEVTVAAANVYDQMEIKGIHVKRARVSHKQADAWRKSGKTLLVGNQPLGRVARKPISAEEPFYEEDLYPFAYPESVDKRLRPGWRAAIITVPAKEAMVQVGDYVDVYCTLSNEALGPGGQGTAEIAKGAKVIARFGTTRPGAQPANPGAPREYTLEVTPYRSALMELAKTMGARFALAVAPQTVDGDKTAPPTANDINDPREQVSDRVNGADMAALFGITSSPAGPPPWTIDKYVGINKAGSEAFPNYVPPSRAGGSTPTTPAGSPPSTSGAEGRAKPSSGSVPVAYTPRSGSSMPPPPVKPMPPPPVAQRSSFTPTGAVATTARDFGFRPWKDPSAAGCVG